MPSGRTRGGVGGGRHSGMCRIGRDRARADQAWCWNALTNTKDSTPSSARRLEAKSVPRSLPWPEARSHLSARRHGAATLRSQPPWPDHRALRLGDPTSSAATRWRIKAGGLPTRSNESPMSPAEEHGPIIEALMAYVRENSCGCRGADPLRAEGAESEIGAPARPSHRLRRVDIKAIMTSSAPVRWGREQPPGDRPLADKACLCRRSSALICSCARLAGTGNFERANLDEGKARRRLLETLC